MSQYDSQRKAFALDRAIQLKTDGGLDAIFTTADKIAEYTYSPEMDFKDALARIQQLLKEAPDADDVLKKIDQLELELGLLREDVERQKARKESFKQVAANA